MGLARVASFGGPGLETVIWRAWSARSGAVRRTRRDLVGPVSASWSGGPSARGLVWWTRPGERGLEDPARAVWRAWRGPVGRARGLEDPARSGGPGLESAVWRTRRGLAGLGGRGLVWRALPGDRGLAGTARAARSGGPGLESAAWRTRRGLVCWGPASVVWSGAPGLESVVWRARRAVWRTRRDLAGPASAAQPIWRRPRELAVGLACWPPPRSPRPAFVRGGRPGWPGCRGSPPRGRCRGAPRPLAECRGGQSVLASRRRSGLQAGWTGERARCRWGLTLRDAAVPSAAAAELGRSVSAQGQGPSGLRAGRAQQL